MDNHEKLAQTSFLRANRQLAGDFNTVITGFGKDESY